VDDHEAFTRQGEDQAFAQAAQLDHLQAGEFGGAGRHRPQHEGARQADGLQRLASDPGGQGLEIDGDVGVLGHGALG
jgi:hypothetical protein